MVRQLTCNIPISFKYVSFLFCESSLLCCHSLSIETRNGLNTASGINHYAYSDMNSVTSRRVTQTLHILNMAK